jgi:PAS domain S-box-containing protein
VEPDGELINEWVTGAFIGITGFTKEEVRSRGGWENLIYQDDISIPMGQLKALQNNQSTTVEYRIVTKNGDIRWMRDHARPVWGKVQGRLSHIFGAVEDITEQKRAEDEKIRLESQLGQAQKMEAIGTLAGGIAHDFNNILAAIIGYSELALPEAKKGTVLYNNLNEVIHAGGRAKDLVKQILTFSRQAHQELKPVQVNLLIKEAFKFLRASLPTSIEIHQDIQSDSLVMADPTQIHQVIMNLCANAEHAMREKGGVLSVELTDVKIESDLSSEHSELKPGQYLKLTVSDSGHGMPSHLMDRIFDPFFTTKEKGEGTGMGLAVVHGIISRCAGTVKVSSIPGKSTTFMVYIPVVKSQFESQAEYEEAVATGSERILLVDDELAIVNMGKQTLGSLGYEVTARTSSYEALELFKAKPDRFDLVITDMTMPNLTGDDLAKELIRIKPDIPIIICTGYSARINKEQALAMGIRAFVSKPVLRRDIAKTIREVLDKK